MHFTGGLAASWLMAGTLIKSGPLRSFFLLHRRAAFRCLFRKARSQLVRSWDSSTRVSTVLLKPGTAMFSVTRGDSDVPEVGGEFLLGRLFPFSLAGTAATAVCLKNLKMNGSLPRNGSFRKPASRRLTHGGRW